MTLNMPGTIGSATLVFGNNSLFTKEKIGIIGLGFVGGAIRNAMNEGSVDLVVHDQAKGHNSTYAELKECSGIFICVPSPQGDDGSCDTSILETVLGLLKEVNYQGVIISKCTAPPDVYTRLNNQYPNLVHAPEFLTAANAIRDYLNGKFAFIGGRVSAYQREAERIIRIGQTGLTDVIHCSIGEASLAKYAINSFLATKVAFMNELWEVATANNIDYNNVAQLVSSDSRIGKSHMQVPGPDGHFGFGGACFPKDTSALLKYASNLGITPMVLDAAVKKNTLLRLKNIKE
jgi:UDPglucose 6-dehydrogenase